MELMMEDAKHADSDPDSVPAEGVALGEQAKLKSSKKAAGESESPCSPAEAKASADQTAQRAS